MKKMTEKQAAIQLALFVAETEYHSYLTHCEFSGRDPRNLQGNIQQGHVYCLALIVLGRDFEYLNDNED